ncbi:hypothetical protein [Oceanisphaera sp. IT1-181]|nr:hypothetical protein [Oceanisphaera sp. IT1-181]
MRELTDSDSSDKGQCRITAPLHDLVETYVVELDAKEWVVWSDED